MAGFIALLLIFCTGVSADTSPNFSIGLTSASVGRYEKLEVVCFSIDSSGYTNPFNPDEVSVEGHFADPDSVEEVVYGFWYQDYERSLEHKDEVLTEEFLPHWRVRYAPKKVGSYTCYLTVTDSGGTVQSETRSFTVTESDSPGFVGVSDQDNRYFEFDNGELFFGIMLDLCWWDYRERTYSYDYYFSEMEAHGANFARLWLYNSVDGATEGSWVCHIQDSSLGADYDLADSWRLDCIVESAREKGVYLMVCFDDVNQLVPNYKWDHNLYNSSWPGGILSEPFAFFTNAQAKAYYRRLMRYMVSRWGYSTSILSWELWNELHELQWTVPSYDQSTVNAWHAEMAQYIGSVDVNDHMVTTSNGSYTPGPGRPPGIDFSMPELSHAQMHGYGFDDGSAWPDLSELVRRSSQYITDYGKPAIWGECGVVNSSWLTSQWIDPDSGAPRHDSTGIFIHNAIWSGLMSGLAATTPYWDWRLLHDYPDWWDQHLAIANFVQGAPLLTASYEVVNSNADPGIITTTSPSLRAYAMKNDTSGLFWIHNLEHSWYDVIVQGLTPQTVSGATMTVTGVAQGGYEVQWWDTYTGTVSSNDSLSTDGSGTLSVPLPDIQTDVACKITSSAGGDTTPPTTPVISTPAQVINADTFAVELSTPSTDDNFSNYQVLGGQYSTWTNTGETGPFVFTLVQNAANTLSIRGRDTSSNVSSAASVVITEDSVLPTTPVIAGGDQVVDADNIVLTLPSPSTDVHFSNYQLRGGQYSSWTDVAETDNFQFTLTEGAAHTLRIRGTDEADNVSAAASVIVTEDSTYPTAPTIAAQPQTVNADSMTVTLASPSTDANLAGYQLRGGQYNNWTNTALTDNFVFNLVQNADNVLEVRGVDGAGHVSAADSVTITEDSQAPAPPGQPLHAD
jgi:hypothetical protein